MDYRICISTDKGIVKEVNQDAAMVKVASTKTHGRILFGVMCDGMGGLSCGEVASSKAVKKFENWFLTQLPGAFSSANATEKLDEPEPKEDCLDVIAREWNILAQDINDELIAYGRENAMNLGTTAVCFLVMAGEYLIMNIGDSRAYLINEAGVTLLTHDQSVVQSMIDRGIMTQEQAQHSHQKNVLLQCLGVSDSVAPQMVRGRIEGPSSVVLCSDGFWRKLEGDELKNIAKPENCADEPSMKCYLDKLVEQLKYRGETDNITALELRLY